MTQLWGLRHGFCTTSAVLSIGLLMAVVSAGLAACGYYQSSNQGSTPPISIQSQTQTTQTQTRGVWRCSSPNGPALLGTGRLGYATLDGV